MIMTFIETQENPSCMCLAFIDFFRKYKGYLQCVSEILGGHLRNPLLGWALDHPSIQTLACMDCKCLVITWITLCINKHMVFFVLW